jgi:X breakpoint 2-interacting protein
MEKKKETRSGMEIMNLLQKEGRQRGTWSGKKTDSDFYKKIVDAYEAKNQELMAENTDLRALLRSTQGDMRSFLNASGGLTNQSLVANGRHGADPSQSPLGGKTVHKSHYKLIQFSIDSCCIYTAKTPVHINKNEYRY